MRSRILLGVGAWVLGASAATAGSLYAVDQLGQSLLTQHTKEISVAMVNAELALENAATGNADSDTRRRPRHRERPTRGTGARLLPLADRARSVQQQASKLLTSPGGTAAASCDGGLARLLYWSPAQGFEADDVSKGPSRVASVSFTDSSGGVVMRVSCNAAGVPVAHVSPLSWGGGSHHDE